jgi:hypothetical protein
MEFPVLAAALCSQPGLGPSGLIGALTDPTKYPRNKHLPATLRRFALRGAPCNEENRANPY